MASARSSRAGSTCPASPISIISSGSSMLTSIGLMCLLYGGFPGLRRQVFAEPHHTRTQLATAVATARRLDHLALVGDGLLNAVEGGSAMADETLWGHQTAMQVHDALGTCTLMQVIDILGRQACRYNCRYFTPECISTVAPGVSN